MNSELIKNIDKLHTTELGEIRIKRNLSLECDDTVRWCRDLREKTAVMGGRSRHCRRRACAQPTKSEQITEALANGFKRCRAKLTCSGEMSAPIAFLT